MQVSAVGNSLNNINFSGRYSNPRDYEEDFYDDDDIVADSDYFEKESTPVEPDELEQLAIASKNVTNTAYKASQDVSPVTVVASLIAAVGTVAAMKGKAMPMIRRGAATIMEGIGTGFTKLFGKIAGSTQATIDKRTGNITNFADKIREDFANDKLKEEYFEEVPKFVNKWATKFFGDEEKAKKLVDVMKQQKIDTVGRVFDFVAGTVVAWKFADITSDTVESGIDTTKIQKAVQNLKSLAGTLGLDFTDDQISNLINEKLAGAKAA